MITHDLLHIIYIHTPTVKYLTYIPHYHLYIILYWYNAIHAYTNKLQPHLYFHYCSESIASCVLYLKGLVEGETHISQFHVLVDVCNDHKIGYLVTSCTFFTRMYLVCAVWVHYTPLLDKQLQIKSNNIRQIQW